MTTTLPALGHYQLQQRLYQNTASDIWKAYDTEAQREVILKLYRTDLPDNVEALARYIHNVERVAALHHYNIVSLYGVQVFPSQGPADSLPLVCLALEHVEGITLANYIKSNTDAGKLPPAAEIVALISSIAQALEYAHRRGIIHGNLKPGNILLSQQGDAANKMATTLITDFAFTKVPSEKQSASIPFYMAPEQIQGTSADERSDIYSLGVLLYELYTGMLPFRGNRPIAVMMQHIMAEPTPPDLVNPAIPLTVTQIILRCLAKNPAERFPNATTLAIALAQALHTPVPDSLRHSTILKETDTQPSTPGTLHRPTGRAMPKKRSSQEPGNTPRISSSIAKRKRSRSSLIMLSLITLLALSGAIFGALLLMQREVASAPQAVGHAVFINSSQIQADSSSGINDELQIELTHIPNPVAGKSYYAWFLGDIGQTEVSPIFLGRVPVKNGTIQFTYAGDAHHTNLLALGSRFLITEDNTQSPSSDPLLDQTMWKYYAAIPQTPNPKDALHFSELDHLRHLLVESPELAIRGLHGGLALWFVRDTATVSDLSSSLTSEWQTRDTMDYLDGISLVPTDVPTGTPMLANPQIAQVALLGQPPQNAVPAGYVFQNEPPPGYIYLIQMHLNGVVLSPQSTTAQHQLAIRINGGMDIFKRALTHVYQDAKQLVSLTNAQLVQPSTLTLLQDLTTQAHNAYNGAPEGNALWIYNNLQQLATFDVTAYSPSK